MREITYDFALEDGSAWNYVLRFDDTHRYLSPECKEVKNWTRLGSNKCPNCPLPETQVQCPVARNLDRIVEDSKNTLSCTRAVVTVATKERSYVKHCATQEGLRSLFGVVMASSGCPHLDWLRPLARFHLPFADVDETLWRVLSLQLLSQYFGKNEVSHEASMIKIQRLYKEVEAVNHAFIQRVRSYCQADADKNAIAALDVYVQMFPYQLQSDFSSLKGYFTSGDSER